MQVTGRQPDAVAASSTVLDQLAGPAIVQAPARYSHGTNGILPTAAPENLESAPGDLVVSENIETSTGSPATQLRIPVQLSIPAITTSGVSEKEYQGAIKEIEALCKSPLNQPEYKIACDEYRVRSLKRARDLDDGEQMRRKVRTLPCDFASV